MGRRGGCGRGRALGGGRATDVRMRMRMKEGRMGWDGMESRIRGGHLREWRPRRKQLRDLNGIGFEDRRCDSGFD